jgi:hypothetical protein
MPHAIGRIARVDSKLPVRPEITEIDMATERTVDVGERRATVGPSFHTIKKIYPAHFAIGLTLEATFEIIAKCIFPFEETVMAPCTAAVVKEWLSVCHLDGG